VIGDGVKSVDLARMPDHEGRLVFQVSADGRQRRHMVPMLGPVN
jgi:stress response protein SCP2